MAGAALIAWLLAAVVGVYLLVRWFGEGGPGGRMAKVTRFPITLIFSHPVLAVAGLGLWVGFLITGRDWYAWGAFVLLTVVALLGFAMLTRWLGSGRHAHDARRSFPTLAVPLHILAGLSAFVLVLLTATWETR